MKITVEMDQAQLDDLRERLSFIKGGWERAVSRAMNYGASQARSIYGFKATLTKQASPDNSQALL